MGWFLVGTLGCQVSVSAPDTSGSSIPTYQAPQKGYCGKYSLVSSGSTISGLAQYRRREAVTSGPGTGLGAAGAWRPIRYAEVWVKDATGQRVACTETDGSGNYSFVVTQSPTATYTVEVHSRALSSASNSEYNTSVSPKYNAYVYDDPRYNNYYSLSQSFTADTDKSLTTMSADETGAVLGGAFNILDQMLEANDFLRAQVANCSTPFPGCDDFEVAPLVTAYWKLGFNPNDYYGPGGSGLSFYLPGYRRLFILGGIDGDYNSSDTDHFDNSVILHEFGHFLEDIYFISDSPGGQHSGNGLIDPRLAWSEGWSNFFQAAVRGDARYVDTWGNSSGSTGLYFYVDLENQTGTDTMDTPQNANEGNFREFSVTRILWDAKDTNVDSANSANDNISGAFDEIWNCLTNSSSYWHKSSAAFRQIGLLHACQQTLATASWADLRTLERHRGDQTDYGQYVSATGTCTYTMNTSTNSAYDLTKNSDYLHLRVTSAQSVTITLNYTQVSPAVDLDLGIFNEDASSSSDLLVSDTKENGTSNGSAQSAQVTRTLSAGHYLIAIQAYSPPNTTVIYTLKLNGSQLCPDALP